MFRVVTFYSCKLRSFLLARRAGTLPVSTSHMHDGANCCSKICSRISYADWVLIMQLGCNMDPLTYKLFLESFCRQTGNKDAVKPTKIIDKIYYSPVWFLRTTVNAKNLKKVFLVHSSGSTITHVYYVHIWLKSISSMKNIDNHTDWLDNLSNFKNKFCILMYSHQH